LGSLAGATKRLGCSAQYAEYSTIDCGDKRKGGAVSDARSPLKVANDYERSVPILVPTERQHLGFAVARKGARTLINEKNALLCWGASFSDSHLVDMTRVIYLWRLSLPTTRKERRCKYKELGRKATAVAVKEVPEIHPPIL
jgi:hypothetical protein